MHLVGYLYECSIVSARQKATGLLPQSTKIFINSTDVIACFLILKSRTHNHVTWTGNNCRPSCLTCNKKGDNIMHLHL
jgi:hypothetical protein